MIAHAPPTIVGEAASCDDICTYLFGPPGDPVCYPITDQPRLGQTLGAIFTLSSVSGCGAILLEAYADECPTGGSSDPSPVLQLQVGSVPAGGTLIVDSSRHMVTLMFEDEDENLVVTNGDTYIEIPEGESFDWIEVRGACDTISCFCARTAHPCSQGYDTTVAIDTQVREG